jgi:hypothetical protein
MISFCLRPLDISYYMTLKFGNLNQHGTANMSDVLLSVLVVRYAAYVSYSHPMAC